METVIRDQEKIAKAIAGGKAEQHDVETILMAALQNVAPGAFDMPKLNIKRDQTLRDMYLKVDKNYDPIPRINVAKVHFIEISPEIAKNDTNIIAREAKKLVGKMNRDDILSCIGALLYQCEQEKELARKSNKPYERTETFLIPIVPPEEDPGMLVTTLDHTNQIIYSNSTDIPLNLSIRHQHNHMKSLVVCLLRHVPHDRPFSSLLFDYEISNSTKLNLFISLVP